MLSNNPSTTHRLPISGTKTRNKTNTPSFMRKSHHLKNSSSDTRNNSSNSIFQKHDGSSSESRVHSTGTSFMAASPFSSSSRLCLTVTSPYDRFIPNRSVMDMELASAQLSGGWFDEDDLEEEKFPQRGHSTQGTNFKALLHSTLGGKSQLLSLHKNESITEVKQSIISHKIIFLMGRVVF
jgi:hypothetical protein